MINNLTNKCSCWTLDFGRTASMKSLLPSVRQSVRLSDRPSVSKFSQDWIISFIWYCAWWYLTIVLSSDWRSQIFEKKKNFFFATQIWAQAQNEIFRHFLEFGSGSLVFLEIGYNYSLQQWLTSTRGLTQWKKFLGPNLGQTSKNRVEN